mmetsp:Transcript_28738/g.46530  ORF Transcript_28738/g.46530 Transcript_28738/m.46530 type:complete len:447 (+) Transcript_28738:88-1428(+)
MATRRWWRDIYHLFDPVLPRGDHTSAAPHEFPFELEAGLFFYGKGNKCEQFVQGKPNPYFEPAKPTVIYCHGFAPNCTARSFRESFNWKSNDVLYGLDVNTADVWIHEGWNCAIFCWSQFADEEDVRLAEEKIWSRPRQNESGTLKEGMRWRYKLPETKDLDPHDKRGWLAGFSEVVPEHFAGKSVTDIFYETYVAAFSVPECGPVRIVGHSIGTQLAVSVCKALHSGAPTGIRLPSRVALLDAFFSWGKKEWLGGKSIGNTVIEHTRWLRSNRNVIFEMYQTSFLGDMWMFGDPHHELRTLTAYVSLSNPSHIPSYNVVWRHVAAPNLYFMLMAEEKLPVEVERVHMRYLCCGIPLAIGRSHRPTNGNAALVPPSPKTSDVDVARCMYEGFKWLQVTGNMFERLHHANASWSLTSRRGLADALSESVPLAVHSRTYYSRSPKDFL